MFKITIIFQHYIFIYIVVINSIVNILVPFIVLLCLNFRTYKQIKEFEQRLSSPQLNVSFQNPKNEPQPLDLEAAPEAEKVDEISAYNSAEESKIATEVLEANDVNGELQEELKKFFERAKKGKKVFRLKRP